MKNRFTTLDVMAAIHDLKALEGMRVNNVYDINSKTYMIKLQKPEEKAVILFESGMRIHRTWHDWPKSQFPSSFSMKLRKHIKQRRLESVKQLGVDRVVCLSFGDGERAVHVIVELYDRGNVLLTDADHVILNILRPRTDKDTDVKLSVKQTYPVDMCRQSESVPDRSELEKALAGAKKGDNLRRLLAPLVQFGGPLIDHVLAGQGFVHNAQMETHFSNDAATLDKLEAAIKEGVAVYDGIRAQPQKGYVTYKEERRADGTAVESYQDYHPFLFAGCKAGPHREFPSFSEAVDDFYGKMEAQKTEQRALNMEREAIKKLDNVKRDQEGRIKALAECQEQQKLIAERIIVNKELVERALLVIRSAIANQLSWDQIQEMKDKAAAMGDPVASSIVKLKLDSNQFTLRLEDPYDAEEKPLDVPIDIALNAFQNSRKFFEDKKAAAEKQQKTVHASAKAIKSAQQKTRDTLEQVRVRVDVAKTRKPMWFEKFLWFISSENYIVVSGRDAQQNELLVKRYLRAGDIYMHADIRGAASVVIRNKPGKADIPPKTLTEAAQAAVCYSNAWEAKVVASAWWVRHDQVSRTAPSGEYLSAGSFMIRGKKNFMPASQLVMGFGLVFRLDEESAERHRKEGKVDATEDQTVPSVEKEEEQEQEVELDGEEEGEKEEDKAGSGGEEEEFPDVQVSLPSQSRKEGEEEYHIIEIGPKGGRQKEKTEQEKEREKYVEQQRVKEEAAKAQSNEKKPLTKRQKHKMEKIKKKYADQDEEEREMRMALLGSRGKAKPEEKAKEEPEKREREERPGKEGAGGERREQPRKEKEKDEDEEDDESAPQQGADDAEGLLDQLTGRPTAEDGLLYVVPMCAPYNTLQNYKYKVKLTPGTGKRGKAAKSAIELFLRSKTGGVREDALMKALLGDEATARNIPGKVRVSAPQLNKK